MARLGDLGGKLYRGELSVDFVGRRKTWYLVSALILVVCFVTLLVRGLNLGIEFKGGTVFQFAAPGATLEQVRSTVEEAAGVNQSVVQQVGNSGDWRAQIESLTPEEITKTQQAIATEFGISDPDDVNSRSVGASWGADISRKALQGMIFFLIAIVIYLSLAFEWKMAVAAIVALGHDILITVGAYSLIGFEVTPASVVGLLTILGYSLYDTVVVFDKVRENTAPLLGGARMTYSQAANLAVNQTLVRSINTSVVALLPVAGILFVGAGLLGAGTLKDLALVLLVGMLAGTYSSIFIATPLLAQLKEQEPQFRALAKRVSARQAVGKAGAARPQPARRPGRAGVSAAGAGSDVAVEEPPAGEVAEAEVKPKVGATPARRAVQTGPRQQPKRSGGGGKKRPSGGKKKR